MPVPLYDQFSGDYDRFVNWERRLASELPFIEAQLAEVEARTVLDAACGTGRHAIALAERGYMVTGADPSTGMIERARQAAAGAGLGDGTLQGTAGEQQWDSTAHHLPPRFEVAAFGELADAGMQDLDAVLCLGSSLPHVLNQDNLAAALADFAAVLRPGGRLLIQNRNFDRVLARRERWMPPLSHREGEHEWLFLRLYDFNPDGTIAFNVITLQRGGEPAPVNSSGTQLPTGWVQSIETTQLYPWRQTELLDALDGGGWQDVVCWGDMQGAPFVAERSPNLVITTTRGP